MEQNPRRSARRAARALRDRLELERRAGLDFVRRPREVAATPPPAAPPRAPAPTPAPPASVRAVSPRPAAAPVDPATLTPRGRLLLPVQQEALECTRCPLQDGRTQVVFGVGNPDAKLVFVGEAPGFDEDQQGEPFVGRAGKLLDKLMEEVGIRRRDVYITNTIKCRPPDNRVPAPAELLACAPWLDRQLKIIVPRLVVTLGNVPTKALLKTETGIVKMRGQKTMLGSVLVIPTFHPAYLLRNPPETAKSQADFRLIAEELANL